MHGQGRAIRHARSILEYDGLPCNAIPTALIVQLPKLLPKPQTTWVRAKDS